MINSWQIYWITRLDSLCTSITIMFVVPFIIWVIANIIYCVANITDDIQKDNKPIYRKWLFKITPIYLVILLGLSCFIPSTKEVAAIYLIPKIVNNEQIQKLPNNTALFLNKKLEQWIDKMTNEEKKK